MNSFNTDDKLRYEIKIFLEKILITACNHQAKKLNITRSKYIRYAVVEKLITDGYPLNEFTDKFNEFCKYLKTKNIEVGITACR